MPYKFINERTRTRSKEAHAGVGEETRLRHPKKESCVFKKIKPECGGFTIPETMFSRENWVGIYHCKQQTRLQSIFYPFLLAVLTLAFPVFWNLGIAGRQQTHRSR